MIEKIAIATVGIILGASTFTIEEANAAVFNLSSNSTSIKPSYNLSEDGIGLKVTGSYN